MARNYWWRRFLSSKQPSRKSSRPARFRPFLEILEDRLVLSTFLVTNALDNGGVNPAVGAGTGTLRQAIVDSNAAGGSNTIDFAIFNPNGGPQTISLASALPAITSAVTIDGTSQATSQSESASTPLIVLNGSGVGTNAIGLLILADNSTVKDLAIDNFGAVGIDLQTGGGNTLTGNYIGVNTSNAAAGNGDGIDIYASSNNTIGGTTAGTGNIISGNTRNGVNMAGSSANNVVQGNYIGTDASSDKLGNGAAGVIIENGSNANTVGGTTSAARNFISANTYGVILSDSGTTNNAVEGNYIGTNVSGVSALGNSEGVLIQYSASGNTTGGTTGAGNVISSNTYYGVYIVGSGATNNAVQGNYIGTEANGTTGGQANGYGVYINGSANNTVGGTATGAGNVISANTYSGVAIVGSGASGNAVQGNSIGIGSDGTTALGNGNGVYIIGAASNTIGGTMASARNIISDNSNSGVEIADSGASSNLVEGNYIGTDKSGTTAVGNGNGVGVIISATTNNTIGGTALGAGNVISANPYGVYIGGSGASGNAVQGNSIGTQANGTTPLSNIIGVIINQVSNNTVGGTASGAGNIIANSSYDGVSVSTGTGNAIRENSIYNSGHLGIDLLSGGNNNQAAPTLTGATTDDSSIAITGTLTGTSGTQYTLDFFASPTKNASGNGEGQVYLGSTTVTPTSSSPMSFTTPAFSVPVPAGYYISATATDPNGNTSAFATDVTATTNLFTVTNTSDSGTSANGSSSGSLRQMILNANAATGFSIIDFAIPSSDSSGGVYTISPGSALPTITNPVTIDGSSQTGFSGTPLIVLNGSGITASNTNGLTIKAGYSAVKDLAIDSFTGDGIELETGGNDVLTGNYIGVTSSGTAGAGNNYGVYISGSANNTIGGTTAGDRNVISANTYYGVYINGIRTSGNVVQGNYIGTDYTGTQPLGNDSGVYILDAPSNTIGGTTASARNVISDNSNSGVEIANSGASSNVVEGNYIGTDYTGTTAVGNGNGVGVIISATTNNMIGGTTSGAANIIANSSYDGVQLYGGTGDAIRENSIHDNGNLGIELIGNANNNPAAPVLSSAATNGTSITIQGTLTAAANTSYALDFFATPSGSSEGQQYLGSAPVTPTSSSPYSFTVTFNVSVPLGYVISATATDPNGNTSEFAKDVTAANLFIVTNTGDNSGVNPAVGAGTGTLRQAIVDANAASGPSVIDFAIPSSESSGGVYTISPATVLPIITNAVTIDGSTQTGFSGTPLIVLNGSSAGSSANGLVITAGNSTVKDLVIDDFTNFGIELEMGGNDVLTGNYIGVTSSGTARAGNNYGVYISGSANNTIGGTTASARNIISGNTDIGVYLNNSATGNVVEGNYIGTDYTGTQKLGNLTGVEIAATSGTTSGNTIGGTAAGAGNVISGNGSSGVYILSSGVTGNAVEGNYIGTEENGTIALANYGGVYINGSANNTIGGTMAGAGNVISGNNYGVEISGSGATGNAVQGNYIGTDYTGTQKLGNGDGVYIASASGNTIGGTTASARNVISANTSIGVYIAGSGATGNVVEGNYIGTDKNGAAALGNYYGMSIYQASGNTIGGTATGAGNIIADSSYDGVDVYSATDDAIRQNYIYNSGNLGIQLLSGNNNQPAPTLTSATISGSSITINGTFAATANTTYALDFFANQTANPSGAGEGQQYLGSVTVTPTATGAYSFSEPFTFSTLVGDVISATITDPNGNTSAFAEDVTAS